MEKIFLPNSLSKKSSRFGLFLPLLASLAAVVNSRAGVERVFAEAEVNASFPDPSFTAGFKARQIMLERNADIEQSILGVELLREG